MSDTENDQREFDLIYWNELNIHQLIVEIKQRGEDVFEYEGTVEYKKGRLNCLLDVLTMLATASPADISPTYFEEEINRPTAVDDYTEGYSDEWEVLYMDFRTKFGY